MSQSNISQQDRSEPDSKNHSDGNIVLHEDDKQSRRRRFWSNWQIGMPLSLALGAGIGFATGNLVTGLIIGLVFGVFSGFVIEFLKSTIKPES